MKRQATALKRKGQIKKIIMSLGLTAVLFLAYSFWIAPAEHPQVKFPGIGVHYLNTTYEENVEAIEKINAIRQSYGIAPLEPYKELYELAYFRAKDMHERNYFDHITPEGKDVWNFRAQFGIGVSNPVYENIFQGIASVDSAISSWMESTKGHRENLLKETRRRGAIACYYTKCVFLGAR